ncbi:MAG TPA: hypothetical protein PLY93_15430 [Turneriella sp.]|nr:hypothetical protein [Turneriella sp.]
MTSTAPAMENQSHLLPHIDLEFWLNAAYMRFIPQSIRWNLGESLYNVFLGARRKATGARLGTAFLGDITVKYLEWGRPQLPKLVILHGFSDSKPAFSPLPRHRPRHPWVWRERKTSARHVHSPAIFGVDYPLSG